MVAGLGDSYGEMSELNANLLKKLGPSVIPLLKKDFDPAGLKAMARRVEVIAALEGKKATPWLREILPQTKKEVRSTVIRALGMDKDNADLLLDLAKFERGKNREAALAGLALQDGGTVRDFWEAELEKKRRQHPLPGGIPGRIGPPIWWPTGCGTGWRRYWRGKSP